MKMIEADMERLYLIFRQRGLLSTQVAKDMGFNSGYFANARKRGTLSKIVVDILDSKYNIKQSDYSKSDIKTPTTKDYSEFFTESNKNELYQIIYAAIYHAMKKALNE